MPDGRYVELDDLKSWVRIGSTDTLDDSELSTALIAAESAVDDYCGRRFDADASATARLFVSGRTDVVTVDDMLEAPTLVETRSGTTWTAVTDFQLEPLNGVVDGVGGWPYWRLRATESTLWPTDFEAAVRVTAKWGWPAVPSKVKQAVLIGAHRLVKRRESPEGLLGFETAGVERIGRLDPDLPFLVGAYRRVEAMLAP